MVLSGRTLIFPYESPGPLRRLTSVVVTRVSAVVPPGRVAPPLRYWLETKPVPELYLILVQLPVVLTAVTVWPR